MLAGAGDDIAYGGSGTDFLIGETSNDLMYGGQRWDAIDGRQGSDVLYGDGGADIIFGDGYFYLFGFSNDSLFGGDDNDIMMGKAGESSMDGAGDAIHGVLGYAGTTPRAAGTNLMQVVDSGGNALVQIDPAGPGPQGFSTLVTMVGVNAADVTDGFFLFQ